MFQLGSWRNYDELEEYLSMDELVATYNAIIKKENERMEFEAKVAGAEFKGGPPAEQTEQAQNGGGTLRDRIEQRKQEKLQQDAVLGKDVEAFEGVGYQIIGG